VRRRRAPTPLAPFLLALASLSAAAPPATASPVAIAPYSEGVLSKAFETILADSQRIAYAPLSPVDRCLYRSRFWLSNDPTPTTERNEFLEERLAFALNQCCPTGETPWDARGEIALRFGVPPARSKYMGDVLAGIGIDPPAETWTYPRMDMTIHFLDANLDGTYALGKDVKKLSPRRTPTPVASVPTEGALPEKPPRDIAAEFEQAGYRAITEVPASFSYEPPVEPIPFVYEVIVARGTGDATDVSVNYQFPMSGLSYAGKPPNLAAHPVKRLRVMTPDHDIIKTDARSFDVTCESADVASSDLLLVDEWRLDMAPGDYVLAVSVEDPATGRTGHGKSRVSVPSYAHPGLRMSDVIVATAVSQGTRFRRMGGSVVPHPVRASRADDELLVYFKLYGLTEDRPGRSRFTVETEVSGRNPGKRAGWFERFFRRRRHSIASRIAATGEAPDTPYWFELSATNLVPDSYDLTVTVVDATSGTEVSQTATFTVLER
jgi:hypothetical protein